jgi:SP family sugar:H+ symporter-like MFS transporter
MLGLWRTRPKSPIGWNISYQRQQLISSLMTLGAFIGSSLAGLLFLFPSASNTLDDYLTGILASTGPIAIVLGRRSSLWVSCALIYIANIIMMTTTSIAALYVGRVVMPIGNGILLTFSQLYIQVQWIFLFSSLSVCQYRVQ